MKQFVSPQDFLEYVQRKRANPPVVPPPTSEQERFRAMTEEQLRKHGIAATEDQLQSYSLVLQDLVSSILSSLPPGTRTQVTSQVAIGSLDTGEANATILKSKDGRYAVLVNCGLFTLFHKFLKCICAKNNPGSVTFCNRKPAAQVTAADLQEYAEDQIANYRTFRVPYGVMLKLTDSAMSIVSAHLFLGESFAICHEIGHFLNGDLNKDSHFTAYQSIPQVTRFAGPNTHDKEYNADRTGYDIVQRVLGMRFPQAPSHAALQSIVIMFSLFSLVGGDSASQSHPSPTDRVLKLAAHFHGADFADALKAGYRDPAKLDPLWNPPTETGGQP